MYRSVGRANIRTTPRCDFFVLLFRAALAVYCASRSGFDFLLRQNEIQAIIRQLTASITFLPLLTDACTFDLLVYTDQDVDIPQVLVLAGALTRACVLTECFEQAWEESDPRYITNQQEVRLRSFSTKVHKVDTTVAFAADADDGVSRA